MAIPNHSPRPPGRPRDEAADRKIIEATLRLLSREGYDRTSIEAVAAEAEVTRATVYRRYPTKADMVTAAVCTIAQAAEPCGCPDARSTLIELLRAFQACVGPGDGVSIAASLYLQRREHPELLESFRERVTGPSRLQMAAVLELAKERGEISAGTDSEVVIEMLIGSYLYRTFAGRPIPENWPEEVVDAVWPALRPDARRPARGGGSPKARAGRQARAGRSAPAAVPSGGAPSSVPARPES
jgi:AcrR family transcriptional regulator